MAPDALFDAIKKKLVRRSIPCHDDVLPLVQNEMLSFGCLDQAVTIANKKTQPIVVAGVIREVDPSFKGPLGGKLQIHSEEFRVVAIPRKVPGLRTNSLSRRQQGEEQREDFHFAEREKMQGRLISVWYGNSVKDAWRAADKNLPEKLCGCRLLLCRFYKSYQPEFLKNNNKGRGRWV